MGKFNIPKHTFCFWRACSERLDIKGRLLRLQIPVEMGAAVFAVIGLKIINMSFPNAALVGLYLKTS